MPINKQKTKTAPPKNSAIRAKWNFPTKAIWSRMVKTDPDSKNFIPLANMRYLTTMHALVVNELERDRQKGNLSIPFKQLSGTFLGKSDMYALANYMIDFALLYVDWNQLLEQAQKMNAAKVAREQEKASA